MNLFTFLMPLVLLYQGDMEEYFDQQSALMERNKQIFLWIMFGLVGLINACIQYEKLRFDKEKRRELKIDNDIKEKKMKDENI